MTRITDDVIQRLLRRCHYLHTLDVSCCSFHGNQLCAVIAARPGGSSGFRSLSLSYLPDLDDEGIAMLTQHTNTSQSLEVRWSFGSPAQNRLKPNHSIPIDFEYMLLTTSSPFVGGASTRRCGGSDGRWLGFDSGCVSATRATLLRRMPVCHRGGGV